MTIREIKERLLAELKTSDAAESAHFSTAYRTLCEAEQIEVYTAKAQDSLGAETKSEAIPA